MSDTGDAAGRVLLVDDDEAVIETYEGFLSDRYAVQTATDGPTALDLVDHSTDVVLLDRRMPTMSGDEVLTDMREQGTDAAVVLVTAVDPEPSVMDLPLDDYLTKPVEPQAIPGLVESMRARRQLPDPARDLLTLVAKRNLLDRTLTAPEFDASGERERLDAEIRSLLPEVDVPLAALERAVTGDLPDMVRAGM
jgi:DNA-binding response OmpR family regulator